MFYHIVEAVATLVSGLKRISEGSIPPSNGSPETPEFFTSDYVDLGRCIALIAKNIDRYQALIDWVEGDGGCCDLVGLEVFISADVEKYSYIIIDVDDYPLEETSLHQIIPWFRDLHPDHPVIFFSRKFIEDFCSPLPSEIYDAAMRFPITLPRLELAFTMAELNCLER